MSRHRDPLRNLRPFMLRLSPGMRPPWRAPEVPDCVVLFGRPVDPEFDALERLLRFLGVPLTRIDSDGAGPALDTVTPRGSFTVGNCPVRPTVCWARRSLGTVTPTASDVLCRDSWAALAGQLTALAPLALPGSRLGLLEQLSAAARHGVRVPDTIVTTNPARAVAGLPGEQVVIKVLGEHFVAASPTLLHGVFPQVLARKDAPSRVGPGLPVVVQEYVPHLAEYRVYYLRGRLFTFRVRKPCPAALWRKPDTVTVQRVTSCGPAEAVARTLAERWGILYGAFDLLLAPDGLVFLELNHDGDWRWFEAKAGTRCVSTAAALMVRDMHALAGGGGIAGGQGFDLLSFLAS